MQFSNMQVSQLVIVVDGNFIFYLNILILVGQLNIDIVLVNQFLQLRNENILFFLQDECFVFQDVCLSFDLLLCQFGVEWRRERERVRK